MDKGVTHYAHWFQPLTGRTAEKHDSFFTLDSNQQAIEEFNGSELAQQEPDGSSFPGGGLRTTFEARGYTAWDPTSPAFILEMKGGKTLCIPTIFVTYSGEAMDYKLPLLKSQAFLEDAAIKVGQFFQKDIQRVNVTLGWEQEYFLIDEALFYSRPDLVMTGRTLVGKSAPKGQQLDDHYFGAIPERVYSFMRDLEIESHRLGIPVRTRHNEVGPGQYELAPMFEEVNVAVDHNQLLMDLMDKIAIRHKLRVLLHEKPFEEVNGSGKHNNWSMATNTGKNLLSPGKSPGKNLRFLAFFVTVIRAVKEHSALLRASVASASNDHRLGANEAPPAIVSVFIGQALTRILNNIEKKEQVGEKDVEEILDLLSKIPNLEKDNTDRNRTSPFAFTGNKFEIRMVGSTMNCAAPMTVMNTIVGAQLKDFYAKVETLRKDGADLQLAILEQIRNYITESRDVLFEGDGYSEAWEEAASKRGLPNTPNTPDALPAYISPKSIELFGTAKVLSERELKAHYEVMVENYILKRQIESRTLGEMVYNHIIPVAVKYQTEVAANIQQMNICDFDDEQLSMQFDILNRIQGQLTRIKDGVNQMRDIRRTAHEKSETECAKMYANDLVPVMEEIRIAVDRLEYLISDATWPFAKYRELLFVR
jgi:glutamine synthetase